MGMKLPKLYGRTSTGAIQEWSIEIEQDRYRTIYGQVDGKLQTTEWTVSLPTNEGRANFRDAEEQALFEAHSIWKKKQESGYFEDVKDIDIQLFVEPMLAKNWKDRKDGVKFPVYCQPKLDGLRAVITKDGAKSRNGKPWVTIPHILEVLKPVFEKYPNLVLDGELYTHTYKDDFNAICSLVKRTKPSEQDLKDSAEKVEFWWYDTVSIDHTFRQRKNWIAEVKKRFDLPNFIVVVPTYRCDNLEELDEYYGRFLDEGYEGQMVRLDTPYECKRSSNLLKRKEFQDKEYPILDIVEGVGNRKGLAGYMIMDNGGGLTFKSNIKGDRKYLKHLLDEKHTYIGCDGTVRFFNLTPDNVPRFPYIYSIRAGE